MKLSFVPMFPSKVLKSSLEILCHTKIVKLFCKTSFSHSGREGTLVLFVVRGRAIFQGYFFQTISELWVSFSQSFDISRNDGCPFQGILHNFRNYGPDIYSICGFVALKSTRIYGIMGTNFSAKMARPPSHNMLSYPPPPPKFSHFQFITSGKKEESCAT